MSKDFDFLKTTMPPTRKADYYISCLNSSVFIDFNLTENNLISLVRVSFDGYGCCTFYNKATPLNHEDSQEFIKELRKKELHQETAKLLILKAININKKHLWIDALKEYNLIEF